MTQKRAKYNQEIAASPIAATIYAIAGRGYESLGNTAVYFCTS